MAGARRRWRLLFSGCLLASSVIGCTHASAGRGHSATTASPTCTNGNGVDLNKLFAVSEPLVTEFCERIRSDSAWLLWIGWQTSNGSNPIYPKGYKPSDPLPLKDFQSKLTGFRFIVRGGNTPTQTYYLEPSAMKIRDDVDANKVEPGGPADPMVSLLLSGPKLPAGSYTVDVQIELSAQHCDGLGTRLADNCLPDGYTSMSDPYAVEVVA